MSQRSLKTRTKTLLTRCLLRWKKCVTKIKICLKKKSRSKSK